MIDDESPEKGMLEAHTRAKSAATPPAPAAPDDLGDDDASLIDGSPDLGGTDLLTLAAETVAEPRRARGRPKGSANKRNMDMVAYLAALGHRDPMVTLSMLQTADTGELARRLGTPVIDSAGRPVLTAMLDGDGKPIRDDNGELVRTLLIRPEDPLKVAQMQRQAASDMLPYFYAKKPQQLELGDGADARPVMVIGEMTVNQRVEGSVIGLATLPVVQPEKANEINGDIVRENETADSEAE